MFHVTDTGLAVAVAVTLPTVALTEYGCQIAPSTQSHVGRFTTAPSGGLNDSDGVGNLSEFSA